MSMTRSHLMDHADAERVEARRQEIKRKIGERKTKQCRVDGLMELLADVKSDLQQSEADHDATVEPLRTELADLDQKMVDAYVAGRTPQDDAARRRELNRSIYDAGRELEITRQANHEQQRKLNRQIDSLRVEIGRDASLETDLERLAPLALQGEARGVGELTSTLLRHSESLASALRAVESQLSDGSARFAPHGDAVLRLKADALRTQAEALSEFIDELKGRGEALREQLLDC